MNNKLDFSGNNPWKIARDERIKLADENRKNGVYDPLNELVDGLAKLWREGKFNKPSKTAVKRAKNKY